MHPFSIYRTFAVCSPDIWRGITVEWPHYAGWRRDVSVKGTRDGGVFLRRHCAMESTSWQAIIDCFATILTAAQHVSATIWPRLNSSISCGVYVNHHKTDYLMKTPCDKAINFYNAASEYSEYGLRWEIDCRGQWIANVYNSVDKEPLPETWCTSRIKQLRPKKSRKLLNQKRSYNWKNKGVYAAQF